MSSGAQTVDTPKLPTKVGFGGGCHWCTEAVFSELRGVSQVEQGYISSSPPDDAFSEGVIITFDPAEISLEILTEVHLRTHASTSNHKLRGKYRSAVYVNSTDLHQQISTALERASGEFSKPLVTRILPLVAFKASDERYENYYAKNMGGQFCTRYIDPKLDKIRAEFAAFVTGC